jgi:hypothetical protein
MPQSRTFRWAERAVQPCAPPISPSKWAEYKEVIIRETRQAGLPHTIEYMKREHNFTAQQVTFEDYKIDIPLISHIGRTSTNISYIPYGATNSKAMPPKLY